MLSKKTTLLLLYLVGQVSIGYAMEHGHDVSNEHGGKACNKYTFSNQTEFPVEFFLALKKKNSLEYSQEELFITLDSKQGIGFKVPQRSCPPKLKILEKNGNFKELVLSQEEYFFLGEKGKENLLKVGIKK